MKRRKITPEEYLVHAVLAQALVDLLGESRGDEVELDTALEYVLGYRKIVRRLRTLSPEEKRAWRRELLKNLA